MQPLDRQLGGVKLTLLLNLRTVTVDPKLNLAMGPTNSRTATSVRGVLRAKLKVLRGAAAISSLALIATDDDRATDERLIFTRFPIFEHEDWKFDERRLIKTAKLRILLAACRHHPAQIDLDL